MRRLWWSVFVVLVAFSLSFADVTVIDPGNNTTLVLTHICEGAELKLLIPAGVEEFRVQIQNVDYEYCCEGPYVTGVFSCSNDALSDSPVAVGNVVSFYSPDGSQIEEREIGVGKTFKMDPLTGSTLLLYFSSDSPTTKECYFLLRADSYIDSVTVYVTKSGASGDYRKDFGCDVSKYCEKCPDSDKKPDISSGSSKKYSPSSSSGSSTSSSSSYTSSSTECHWERVCEPCDAGCGVSRCRVVKVCKEVPSNNPPSSCTACSGSWVSPPFNFNLPEAQETQSNGEASGSSGNPFAGFFAPKKKYSVLSGSSSSSSASSSYSSSGSYYSSGAETASSYSLSGKNSYQCDAGCISNPALPKFYTSYAVYNEGENVAALVYVPKYDRAVDVYLAVEEVGRNVLWVVTVSGNVATAYRYMEGGTLRAYATGLTNSLDEWFYLNEVMPLVRGTYRMYILVVPKGTPAGSLGDDYVLTYYDFEVE